MKGKHIIGSVFAGVLMCATVISASATCVGVGTVKGSGLRLRKEAGLDSAVIATANKGATVVVLEEKNGWYKVDWNTQVGYMSAEYVKVETSVEKDLGWGVVTTKGDPLNVRSGAGTGYGVVTKLNNGTSVKIKGLFEGWYKVTYNDKTGYVNSDYIQLTDGDQSAQKAVQATTQKSASSVQTVQTAAQTQTAQVQSSTLGQSIVNEAKKHIGKAYRSGGKGPNSFDCSGFAYYCVKQASGGSIRLSGGSSTQWRTAPGQRITSISQLQPGDLFFICDPAYSAGYSTSHVAIYAGNGMLIHAADRRSGVVMNAIKDKDVRYFVGGIRLG